MSGVKMRKADSLFANAAIEKAVERSFAEFENDTVVKEGKIMFQKNSEWRDCYLVVTTNAVLCYEAVGTGKGRPYRYILLENAEIEDEEGEIFRLEVLPDHARRSKNSKLFPFDVSQVGSKEESGLLLAVHEASQMWEWVTAIVWRGDPPKAEEPPHVHCSVATDYDDHFTNPAVLQARLQHIMTYHATNIELREERIKSQQRTPDRPNHHDSDDSYDSDDSMDYPRHEDEPPLDPDAPHWAAIYAGVDRFAMTCMVGACIHAAERNFEMMISTGLVNLSNTGRMFNSPLSMTTEGNYTTSRESMIKTLIQHGCPVGREMRAANRQFVHMLCKPNRCWGLRSVIGQAIHDDDKRLVNFFIQNGDGVEYNEEFEEAIAKAADDGEKEFEYTTSRDCGMTIFKFSSLTISNWASSTLMELNISSNSLTTLPHAFFDMTNLSKLDLSYNLLWQLSPRIKNMTKLSMLHLNDNLLEALPDELELLEDLVDFQCSRNPITYPPKSIVVRGLRAIQDFFKDGRTRGTRANTDLKVLVLGLSEAGKTSLINGILDGHSRLMRRGDRTVGIEQRTWSFPREDPARKTATSPFGESYRMPLSDDNPDLMKLTFPKSGKPTLMFPSNVQDYQFANPEEHEDEPLPDTLPAERELTNMSWDEESRTLKGEVLLTPYSTYIFSYWRPTEKVKVEIAFTEDYEEVEQGSLRCFRRASDPEEDPSDTHDISKDSRMPMRRVKHMLQDVNLKMYDFAGQQEYYATHHIFLTERALYLLAFDLSKYSTATFHDQVLFWLETIQDRVPDAKLLICGTHADMLPPAVAVQKCEKIANILQNRQSRARKGIQKKLDQINDRRDEINEAKEQAAWERLASTTRRKMDPSEFKRLRKVQRKEEKKKQKHRNENENTDESDVALLLTDEERAMLEQVDEFKKEDKTYEAEEKTMKALAKRCEQQQQKLLNLPKKVYPVSSAEGLWGMDALVAHLKHSSLDRTSFPEMDEQIPSSYLDIRREIRTMRNEKEFWYMPTKKFLEKLAGTFQLTEDEVERAMLFMHTLGEVLHYRKGKVDVVFLKVAYLIDAFKLVIRHDHAESTVFRDDLGLSMKAVGFKHQKKALLESGELTVDMLERLWAPPAPDGLGLTRQSDPERFFNLVELLQDFEIVAAIAFGPEGKPTDFIVPEFEPQDLPARAWQVQCPDGEYEAHRWLQFERVPPRGIMQRLQVKMCSRADARRSVFSKEAICMNVWGCSMFCRVSQGNNADSQFASGIQLIVRGNDKAALWKTLKTILELIHELLNDWPGHPVDEYVVVVSKGIPYYVEHLRLKNEQETGANNFAVSDGINIPLANILIPVDCEEWPAKGASLANTSIAAADDGDPDVIDFDGELELAKVQSRTNAVEEFRERAVLWVALFHDQASIHLAEDLFGRLTESGIPTWIESYSGARGTQSDILNDGLFTAGVVCPIITKAYQADPNSRIALNKAIEDGKLIVPIYGESSVAIDPWLQEILVTGSPFGDRDTVPKLEFTQKMKSDARSTQVEELAKVAQEKCAIKALIYKIEQGQIRRERRKSFSRDRGKSVSDEAENTDGDTLDIPDNDTGEESESFLVRLFSQELKLPQKYADEYVAALTKSFMDMFGNTDAENILCYDDDEELLRAGINKKPHRKKILLWIKQQERNSHDGIVGIQLPIKSNSAKKKIFISYSSKDSQHLFQHLVSVLSLTRFEVFEPTKDLHDPTVREMREHVISSSVLIVIASPSYLDSRYCREELQAAKAKKLKLLPVYDGDKYVQDVVMSWKTAGDDLASFLYSQNLVKVKDVQDQKHATDRFLQKLNEKA